MNILNLYAGVGGNRKLWTDCHVTAVEYDPKIAEVYHNLYPRDAVVVGDAHEYLLNHAQEFDFIWASPPCQSHSRMIRGGQNRKPRYVDMGLYQEILFLEHNFNGQWVVENVIPYYKPMIPPTTEMGRHYLWSNFYIGQFNPPAFKGFIKKQNLEAKRELMDWLGFHFEENLYSGSNHCPTQVLRNCVHPDMGAHIMAEALARREQA